MLFKDFIFSIKNICISFIEKKKIKKVFNIFFTYIYKYFFLELFLYNFFYKKNLDTYKKQDETFLKKNLDFYFLHFNSLKIEHAYSQFYNKFFDKIRKKNLSIMEIGLAKGDGIASFYYYFPNSYFIGLDNNPFRCRYKSKKFRNIFIDIASEKIITNLINHLNLKFDIIIEDCSHKLIDQIFSFKYFFNNLRPGGYFIVEDLNFPELSSSFNPTNDPINLKIILNAIKNKTHINSPYINREKFAELCSNIENINFFKGTGDHSEIAFIKKKL